jgi:hypothetical protein
MGAAGALIIMAWGFFRLMSSGGILKRHLIWLILSIKLGRSNPGGLFRAMHGW